MPDLIGTDQGEISTRTRRLETTDLAHPDLWTPFMQEALDNFVHIAAQLDTLDEGRYPAVPTVSASRALVAADHGAILELDATSEPIVLTLPSGVRTGIDVTLVRVDAGAMAPVEEWNANVGGSSTHALHDYAIDEDGHVYVVHKGVLSAMLVTRYAPDGSTVWQNSLPAGVDARIAVDPTGDRLFIARQPSAAGTVTVHAWRKSDAGTLTSFQVIGNSGSDVAEAPHALTVDRAGALYVAVGPSPYRVRKYDAALGLVWSRTLDLGGLGDLLPLEDGGVAVSLPTQSAGVQGLGADGATRWAPNTGVGVTHLARHPDGGIVYTRRGTHTVAKLSRSGGFEWARTLNIGTQHVLDGRVAVDAMGHPIVGAHEAIVGSTRTVRILKVAPDSAAILGSLTYGNGAGDYEPTNIPAVRANRGGEVVAGSRQDGIHDTRFLHVYKLRFSPYRVTLAAGAGATLAGVSELPHAPWAWLRVYHAGGGRWRVLAP